MEDIQLISVDKSNIDSEHICCAISDKKGETCVSSKKAWLKERFDDGLVFLKLNARGKVLIEYIPAEKAWTPIVANDFMHINCFWVSGQFQGKGYANKLLGSCIADSKAKGKVGLTVVSSDKKRSYLSDPDHLKHMGFEVADTASPYFVLYYLPFKVDVVVPKFKECVKCGEIDEQGMVLYYTNQCPFTEKYVPMMCELAKAHGTNISVHKIETLTQAQNAPTPFTTFVFYFNGKFVTNEIFSPTKFEKFLVVHNF